MALIAAVPLLSVGTELGEGPAWFGDALWFVDIKARLIYRHVPRLATTTRWEAPELVGWVLPSIAGDLLVGLRSGPHRFSPETGGFAAIALVDRHLPANRLNDAAIDRAGRVYFGTMDNAEADSSGRVFVLDRGVVRETAIAPVIISNGPAIDPAGEWLYHVDTLARRVDRHAIAGDGSLGAGQPFLHFTPEQGNPDGAICDAAGGVWIGFYGGWAARRFAPDGRLTDEVRFPVANVTKLAIGGDDGLTAFATTARQGLDAAMLARQPLAGDIFTFPVAIPGIPVTPANS